MATNKSAQPQPTQAVRVLFHILWSLLASAVTAGAVAGGNYIATAGNNINFTVVLTAAGSAFFVFLITHAPSVIQPNQAELLQGINDLLQQAHQPLLSYMAQLLQAMPTAQPPVTITSSPGNRPLDSTFVQPLSISQQPTASIPTILPAGGGAPQFDVRQFVVTQSGIPKVQQ